MVCAVALVFLASLPFTGLDSLWSTNHASQLLLTWVALTVLFLNAVYQDGSGSASLPKPLERLVEASLLAITVFVGIAVYGISLRITQHGLTPTRMWGVLFAIVLGGYAGGYALAALRRGEPWLRTVPAVNRVVALLIVSLGLLVHTPLLDPVGWSARNQLGRLLDGRTTAADFDYGYLRFELGRDGAAALATLDGLEHHPDIDAIREGVATARAAGTHWEWTKDRGPALSHELFTVLPAGTELPDAVLSAARRRDENWIGDACKGVLFCAAFQTDLDGHPPDEWVLAIGADRWNQRWVFREAGDGYEYAGRLVPVGLSSGATDLEQDLKAMRIQPIEALYRDLRIGDTRYHLVPD